MSARHERRAWDRRGQGPMPDPWRDRDACGVGLVARSSGAPDHAVLHLALTALARLAHRGAAASDHSGDGAGVLTQIPRRFLLDEAARLGFPLAPDQPFAVGAFFLPMDESPRSAAIDLIEQVLRSDGFPVLGWREVPVSAAELGPTARATRPAVWQALLGLAPGSDEDVVEGGLYLARRAIERRAAEAGVDPFFVCSLSCRTTVYKALLTGTQLAAFFDDLRHPGFETAIAVFHQRYATNTVPNWALAQPFRLLAHNGEINTLWGNRNAMRAREPLLASAQWGATIERLKPVIWADGSDTASLDNAFELLVRGGRDPIHALMMLVPEAQGAPEPDAALRAFAEYHEGLIEPWDGPAALAVTDGVTAIAAVDRNGLRPCRYKVTHEGVLIAASEAGVADLAPEEVIDSGRLAPGELIAVDTRRSAILHSAQAKREVAIRRPYARWVAQSIRDLQVEHEEPSASLAAGDVRMKQLAFGYGFEDLRYVLESMSEKVQDPVWSMGDDTPLPPLSPLPRSVYTYLRQRFAQVTNPAIDSIRESCVMSLRMHLGRRGSILAERPTGLRLVRVTHPVLLEAELAALRNVAGVQAITVPALWPASAGPGALQPALLRLCRSAGVAIQQGARILIVSDRGSDPQRAPIPMLLAVGALHNHLLRKGLRHRIGLVAEAGDAWDVHHCAALIGYGAEAVHPWLALESVRQEGGREAAATLRASMETGLLKVLAKMGISTLASYCGAQIFEAIGLGAEVIDQCFPGTASMIGGIGFAEIAEDVLGRQSAACSARETPIVPLPDHGRVRYRRDGEDHAWAPPTVTALRQAVQSASPERYDAFVGQVASRGPLSLSDLLALRRGTTIPVDEVEPAESIRRRFVSTAMSLGALSPEAHATLAIGMNRMGARSNSGEGGEDPQTFRLRENGDRADNRIKQVASARFGVTTEYLVRADELEIKIAQGSKPGEGGQLPGHKVTEFIARFRHATPGVSLISPPPHHDIYSIEDLAQLVHDLKQVNPRARVGVKLVSEAGVGRVAAGVAKSYADYVLISGHNGGTGASPLSSIKHAGSPWELGVAEAQAILTENGLRERVELRTDGGLRTARDIVLAAALGAESYGFGTAALVAIGCAMARQCHLNSCPTGIATQRPELRKKFRGTPEQVIAYFTMLAQEVRELLAAAGHRSLQDIIGRTDLLERVDRPDRPRAQLLDLSMLLQQSTPPRPRPLGRTERPGIDSLDAVILESLGPCLESGQPFEGTWPIGNHHLAVGARIAGRIADRHGDAGLPSGAVRLRFRGSAGQSFGAFAVRGMRLELDGEANDYVGKGLCGGEIVIRGASVEHVVMGNTALYGATAGMLVAAGSAGDRFAIRNSGAVAVVEGAGDHCCEYMTGGTVVVLGRVGRNFGAGMTSGTAYVLDQDQSLAGRCNGESVAAAPLDAAEAEVLRGLIRVHLERTRSPRARTMLRAWTRYRTMFQVVRPLAAAPPVPTAIVEPRSATESLTK